MVSITHIHQDHKALLQLLPVVTMWINSNTTLTEQEIHSMARLHPKEFEYAKKTPLAEMFKLAEMYKENRLYRDHFTIILSDKGKKWVERCVGICKKMDL